MVKNREINGTEKIALVTPTPGQSHQLFYFKLFLNQSTGFWESFHTPIRNSSLKSRKTWFFVNYGFNDAVNLVPKLWRWRHNDHAGVSNHQPHGCLLNRLFRRKSKKTSKLRITGLCAGNSPGTGEFPAQMASYAENVSIWWRHHAATRMSKRFGLGTPISYWWK